MSEYILCERKSGKLYYIENLVSRTTSEQNATRYSLEQARGFAEKYGWQMIEVGDELPPLGVHVVEGVSGKDKIGGR